MVNCPSTNGGEDMLIFKEVYYDDQDRPNSYCDPFLCGDTPESLAETAGWLLKATTLPVLHENEFGDD
jgi:hypothetical protein